MASIFSNLSLLNDLLSNFLAVDSVGIYNAGFQQVFSDARPMRVDVRETSAVMSHPVETGTIIADNHIINPVQISVVMIIKSNTYNSVYGQIKQAFVTGQSFSVQTRSGLYPNMIISEMPHQEDPDLYDAITMRLNMVEVLYIVPVSLSARALPANFSPASPANSNTVPTGLKNPISLSAANTTAVQSILTGLAFKYIGGL